MQRKITALLLASTLTFGLASPALAAVPVQTDIDVVVDNRYMATDGQMPFVDAAGRVMAPLRGISGMIPGVLVDWVADTRTVRVTDTKLDKVYTFGIDEKFYKSPTGTVDLDTSATIKDGRTFLPVRAIGELFGTVDWNSDQRLVTIGMASSDHVPDQILVPAEISAEPIGVGSSVAAQIVNDGLTISPYPDRLIKGNINREGRKIYHIPNKGSYTDTVIDESKGERWFASEEEAAAAGWERANNIR